NLANSGPHANESILNNSSLIAVGDDNTLWYDSDGSLSIYNYPNGTLSSDLAQTTFTTGPASWIGTTLASKMQYFIGYEQGNLYFLEGDSTLHVFSTNLVFSRTDIVELEGSLFGYTLGDLVDGNIPNTYYVGWDLGAVVAFVHPDYGGNAPVARNTYSWTHTARFMEDARINGGPVDYKQEIGSHWDVRPHQQLRTMYPSSIVGDGNNQTTSDNLWADILTSDNLIGNSSSIPRAHDNSEDWHFNFIDPSVSNYSYYFYFYLDNSTLKLTRTSFPLTLQNGLNAGQSLLNNDNLIAVGDDNTIWLDADNTVSIYNYPTGTLEYDSAVTQFPQGPRGWIGVPIVEKLPYLIGYEEAKFYFLEGDSTLLVYTYLMTFVRAEEIRLDGDLSAYTLGQIVDRQVPGVTYAGWDLGPIIVMVDTALAIDHFRLSYGSSALTCNPTEVTIQACEDASCSTLYTGSVDVTLSPTGWVGGDTITVTGGSATASLAHTSVGTVTLDVSSSVPAATGSGTQCSIDGGAYSSFCDLTFADSGFLVDVPDFLSARGETATISAVKKSDNSLQCTPAFASTTKTVSLWSDYVLPSSGSMAVSVASSAIGTTSGTATTQSLTFDASGQATAAINYSDAGNMRLQVKYTGSGADAGLVMTGNGEFIARPAGMCVQASGVCSSDYSNCSAFKKAGENFDLTTTAVAWESDDDSNFCSGNSGTPNYSATAISLASSVVSPAGQRDGTVTPTSYDHTAASGGANTVSINESEVGVFNFNVTPPLYQGAALGSLSSTSLVTYSSGPTGRFIPDHFEIAEVTPGRLAATCSTGNLYSGETTTWAEAPEYTFTAHNVGHGITTNYTETGYTKLTAANVFSGIVEPTTDGSQDGTDNNKLAVSLTSNQGSLNIAAADSGVMNYVFSALDDVTYQRSAVAEVAPFIPDLDFSFPTTIADSDGVAVSSLVNFSPDTSAISLRFGRIWLEDGYGPETENLILPLRAEYFDGTGYLINILDDCSGWDDANASADTLTALMTSTGTLVGGSSNADGLLLQAPTAVAGTPDTGKATITLTVPSWLQGDYDNNGFYEDPEGMVVFGIWRGHRRVVYRRQLP
ncbi:MAG: hypothetical protein KBT77_07335, partial [Thalassolituus oleivorans]|uniref:DUF6701 domain-containing protein n=1 Tax=Thalassolituus oleivorans TaxID=187493 RepID=UPI001B66E425|nr:hypothetical protein [Thalassolituus oleivorans]